MLPLLRRTVLLLCLLASSASPCLASGDFHNALSLQGFTGLLNTPNAETTDEGKIYLLYSDQKESKWRNKTRSQDNYLVSLGLFGLLEVGGRFFEAPRVGRDLSGSFKVRVPFIPQGDYWPKFAVGIQDVGGGYKARYLQTSYAVVSEEIWRFRFSAGYGRGPDRMKGVFGGVEAKACDWLYLLAEHDGSEKNVGLRLVTPEFFGYPVNLHATIKSSLDHRPGQPEFSVGLQIPLGAARNRKEPLPVPVPAAVKAPVAAEQAPVQEVPAGKELQAEAAIKLRTLLKRLTDDGFQNVRVGSQQGLLVVEYENARYNWNELDAIGVVAGIAQLEAPSRFDTLRLVEKKKGIAVLQLETPLAELRAFLADAAQAEAFGKALKITPEISSDQGVSFVQGDPHSSYLHASLVLYPQLRTYLGTEVAPFDYLLSLKPDLYLNTWKGAVLNARWEVPVAWSSNFEDNKSFRGDRKPTQMDRLMLFQALKPSPTVMATLGAGMVLHDSYGTLNDLLWSPGDGSHRLKFTQLYVEDGSGNGKKEVYLGSYRYYYAPLDTYLEATAGKFFPQDRGVVAELKRFFGDTEVTVYYKNSVTTDGRNHQAAGIQFQLPLTPRRDMKPYLVQLKGTDEWSYAQESTMAKEKSWNFLGTPTGVKPEAPFNTARVFYNRDRLSDAYLREHLLRLRDAYATYVLPGN